jgi:hypothetical protein
MTYEEWCLNELGYKTQTTYFMDFSIAERFGIAAIRDTYKRALLNRDYKMMTELTMVLNHKIWFTYEKQPELAKVYDELWRDCDSKCREWFNKDELAYFYTVTD